MKISIGTGRLRLKFFVGTGFALYIINRKLKKESDVELPVKEIKKLLKRYKCANGSLTLADIESKDARILIKL